MKILSLLTASLIAFSPISFADHHRDTQNDKTEHEEKQVTNKCELEWLKYEKSAACFANCPKNANGSTNQAKCACIETAKPTCSK